jgi:hypothetical protein
MLGKRLRITADGFVDNVVVVVVVVGKKFRGGGSLEILIVIRINIWHVTSPSFEPQISSAAISSTLLDKFSLALSKYSEAARYRTFETGPFGAR